VRRFHEDGGPAVIRITARGNAADYLLSELPADNAAGEHGYQLVKLAPDGEPTQTVYNVLLNLRTNAHTCDCPGGSWRGRCKHPGAVAALLWGGRADQ
jgi:hypothetical protein